MTLVALVVFVSLIVIVARGARSRICLMALALAAAPASAQGPETIERLRPLTVERWSGWEGLGGNTGSCMGCVATQANRIDCFGSATGGAVTRTRWDGQRWIGPTPMGGLQLYYLEARPECVSYAADHIDCFVRSGSDPALFLRTMHGSFMTGWQALAGHLTSDASCVSLRAERLDCLARGLDGALWHNSFNGDIWSGWISRGAQVQQRTNPSCVVFRNEINCIIVTPANVLRHLRFTGAGIDARDMQGGALQGPGVNLGPKCYVSLDPDLNSPVDDRIHCFAPRIGSSQTYLARWGWNGQGNWSLSDLGENFSVGSDWDCVVRSSQRIDCVELLVRPPAPGAVSSARSTLRHRMFQLGQPVSITEVALPQGSTGAPSFVSCVSWSADRLDCFAGGAGAPLHHAWLTPEPPAIYAPSRPIVRPPGG